MKRILPFLVSILLLFGCAGKENAYNRVILLRSRLQSCQSCTFTTNVTADYGDRLYSFSLQCTSDSYGNIQFTVISPESISGIAGSIEKSGGLLTFEDRALAFDLLADGCASPVSAPWLIMRSLLGGYIRSSAMQADGLVMQIDDSYEDDALMLEIWMDAELRPNQADIFWQGRRIMAVEIKDFSICNEPKD